MNAAPCYTQDWFTNRIPFMGSVLAPFKGLPCRALEIGSYEGRSAVWLFETILTNPKCSLVSVDAREFHQGPDLKDSHTSEVHQRFKSNVSPYADRIIEVIGDSRVVVPKLVGPFDFAYVDGRHAYTHVLFDAVHAWDLVKPGGIIIFDDAFEDGVKNALTAFIQAVKREPGFKMMESGNQVAIRKAG